MLAVWNPALDPLFQWVTAPVPDPIRVPLLMIAGVAFLLCLLPQPRPRTPSFLQTCALGGLTVGLLIGIHWKFTGVSNAPAEAFGQWIGGYMADVQTSLSPFVGDATAYGVLAATRFVLGVSFVLFSRVGAKQFFQRLVLAITGFHAARIQRVEERQEREARNRAQGNQQHPIHDQSSDAGAVKVRAEADLSQYTMSNTDGTSEAQELFERESAKARKRAARRHASSPKEHPNSDTATTTGTPHARGGSKRGRRGGSTSASGALAQGVHSGGGELAPDDIAELKSLGVDPNDSEAVTKRVVCEGVIKTLTYIVIAWSATHWGSVALDAMAAECV